MAETCLRSQKGVLKTRPLPVISVNFKALSAVPIESHHDCNAFLLYAEFTVMSSLLSFIGIDCRSGGSGVSCPTDRHMYPQTCPGKL